MSFCDSSARVPLSGPVTGKAAGLRPAAGPLRFPGATRSLSDDPRDSSHPAAGLDVAFQPVQAARMVGGPVDWTVPSGNRMVSSRLGPRVDVPARVVDLVVVP